MRYQFPHLLQIWSLVILTPVPLRQHHRFLFVGAASARPGHFAIFRCKEQTCNESCFKEYEKTHCEDQLARVPLRQQHASRIHYGFRSKNTSMWNFLYCFLHLMFQNLIPYIVFSGIRRCQKSIECWTLHTFSNFSSLCCPSLL